MAEMDTHDTSTTPEHPESERFAAPETATPEVEPGPASGETAGNMLPDRGRRRLGVERLLVRLIATAGIVGIGVLLGAILVSQKVAGWTVGLAVAAVTVVLSAVLWSSRQL